MIREKTSQTETKEATSRSSRETANAPTARMTPRSAHASIIHLQRTHGNRYVQRFLDSSRQPDEQTADASSIAESIRQARGGGRALDGSVRGQMESAFGRDFSGVRVHTDAQAGALASAVDARAFTSGQDIFFRQGEYDPERAGSRELLAHELTHVVQQTSGAPQPQLSAAEPLTVSQPGDVCEQEADRTAGAVLRGELAAPPTVVPTTELMLQRADDKGWMETANDYWGGVKETAYEAMIDALRSTQAAGLGQLRGLAREMPPMLRVLAEQLIHEVEMVSDILISFLLAVVGIVVGFVSGIAKALWGLLEFIHSIFSMIILFVAGLFSEQRRDEFNERGNAIIEGFKNVPGALRLLLNNWLERYRAASADRRTLMIGELTGEIEAVLATMLGGGAAAKSMPKVEFAVAPARQFATAGAHGSSLGGTVAIGVAGPPVAGVTAGAMMMNVNERARDTSSEQKASKSTASKATKEAKSKPAPEGRNRKKKTEPEATAGKAARRRSGPYPAEWWQVIEDLEKRFPALKDADLRPKRRGDGRGMDFERDMTTNEFSIRAKLRDGTEIELDDILPDGTILDGKSREYLQPRRQSGSIFDRRGPHYERNVIDDADLMDIPREERSLIDQRRTLREVERLGDDSLLSGGSSRVWEDLTVLEELDDFNIRKAYDQMSRQARFLEENGLKRIRWYTDNIKYKKVLEEIKGALKIDVYYIF